MEISNQQLTASFKTKGAELTSLKKANVEYIWQADPAHWNRHAPVLFPIVGKLKENTYQFEGKEYQMGQHGFARDQEFTVISHDAESISFSLKESEDTKKIYPFQFELIISYRLQDSSLEISYNVINKDGKELLFSIGAHPAFNCPIKSGERRSDYRLFFNREEEFVTHRLIDGNFSGQAEQLGSGQELEITDNLFDKDALVFKNLKSDKVSLHSTEQKWLTFDFAGFPYLGIWSKNAVSPFVCIEPWFGLADYVNHNQRLEDKEGIRVLPSDGVFAASYQVEVH